MNIKPVYFYILALFGYFGLFFLLMSWNTVLAPSSARIPVALMLLITVTPLLLPLRGFLNRNHRSCAWMAYISLAYFIHGSVETYANANGRFLPSLEIFLSLLLFFGATLFIRSSGKQG
jgi:uncharacterized membrane protein